GFAASANIRHVAQTHESGKHLHGGADGRLGLHLELGGRRPQIVLVSVAVHDVLGKIRAFAHLGPHGQPRVVPLAFLPDFGYHNVGGEVEQNALGGVAGAARGQPV
ncbi:MAG: hypothetical protein ACK55I_24820, partial [bacterium]